jgi:hypothetical protein
MYFNCLIHILIWRIILEFWNFQLFSTNVECDLCLFQNNLTYLNLNLTIFITIGTHIGE